MKDKILTLIKDNKANVGLLVAVIIASAVLFQLSFVYKAETAKLKEQKEKLSNDAKQVNDTGWLLNDNNSSVAKSNGDSYKEAYNTYYQALIDKYNHDRSAVSKLRPEDVQDQFSESLDSLLKICQNAKVEVADNFEFSFQGVRSQIFQMDPRDKVKIMEQLTAVENLVKIAASCNVKGIPAIVRVNDLAETSVKEKFAKVYTYALTLNADPESFAAFMNKVTNDSSFYYRVNSVSLKTAPQVDSELKPLELSKQITEEEPVEADKKAVASVDELIAGVETETVEEEPEVEVVEKKESVNINAFKSVDQTVVVGLDWIQFKDTYLEK